ncbi:MAG: hypothetical protein ACLRQT_05970 [Alistipes sp.]
MLVVEYVVVVLRRSLLQGFGRGCGEHLLDVRQRGLGAVAEVSGEEDARCQEAAATLTPAAR